MNEIEKCKINAAKMAFEREVIPLLETKKNVVIGVGSGSTVVHFISELQNTFYDNFVTVPSSNDTRRMLLNAELNILPLSLISKINITIDGADELDSNNGNLLAIKGGGGCHLQERLVAAASEKFIVICDYRKYKHLSRDVPVAIYPMALHVTEYILKKRYNAVVTLRKCSTGKCGTLISDDGFLLGDIKFPNKDILYKKNIDTELRSIAGIADVGLFYNMIDKAYIGNEMYNSTTIV